MHLAYLEARIAAISQQGEGPKCSGYDLLLNDGLMQQHRVWVDALVSPRPT